MLCSIEMRLEAWWQVHNHVCVRVLSSFSSLVPSPWKAANRAGHKTTKSIINSCCETKMRCCSIHVRYMHTDITDTLTTHYLWVTYHKVSTDMKTVPTRTKTNRTRHSLNLKPQNRNKLEWRSQHTLSPPPSPPPPFLSSSLTSTHRQTHTTNCLID